MPEGAARDRRRRRHADRLLVRLRRAADGVRGRAPAHGRLDAQARADPGPGRVRRLPGRAQRARASTACPPSRADTALNPSRPDVDSGEVRGSRPHPARLTLAFAAVLVGVLALHYAGVGPEWPARGRAPLRGARGHRRRLLPVARRRRIPQGAQAVARDRARDGQLRRRRALLHDRAPAAGRRHPLPVARRRALPRPLSVLLRRAAAARPLPRRAAAVDAVGRRPDRRARLRRRRLRARLRPRARRAPAATR